MPTITLKDIPAALHRDLKKRAKVNHRSLNKEILATLQKANALPPPNSPESLEQSVRQARS